jgi:hypothetical protein
MDFDKPYQPSAGASAAKAEPAGDNPPKKRTGQAVPALFRKKAA